MLLAQKAEQAPERLQSGVQPKLQVRFAAPVLCNCASAVSVVMRLQPSLAPPRAARVGRTATAPWGRHSHFAGCVG